MLLEPDESVRDALTILLRGEGWEIAILEHCEDLRKAVNTGRYTVVISEASLPDCSPELILSRCKEENVPVIFTGHDMSLQGAVDLIRQGATDFLDKPFPQGRLVDLLHELSDRHNE